MLKTEFWRDTIICNSNFQDMIEETLDLRVGLVV